MRNKDHKRFRLLLLAALAVSCAWGLAARAQDTPTRDVHAFDNHAGFTPTLSGAMAYIQNTNSGIVSLNPQVNPVLLVPFGSHLLLESRAEFGGFFQRRDGTTGPYGGKIYKVVDYAQLDWLVHPRVIVTAGEYLLPFGMYNERLTAVWVKNLQNAPISSTIGTRSSGTGDGFMLRGTATQNSIYSIQYNAYFSARSNINELQAARTAGGDASVFFNKPRLETGVSYQRFLQQRNINSVATYLSWQPRTIPLDLKAEGDFSYNGRGYWIEAAYKADQLPVPVFARKFQFVTREQQLFPLHGGGNAVPTVSTTQVDFGLNYYFRDNLRLVSSYARSFSSQQNANVWNFGVTYRFLWPLLPGRKS